MFASGILLTLDIMEEGGSASMPRRAALLFCAALLLVPATKAVAGDLARFVSLGFSPDGAFYAFGQYGVENPESTPYAEVYIVDVARNAFVPGGVLRESSEDPVDPGTTGLGALVFLVQQNAELFERHEIDPRIPGRIVYLLVDGDEPLPSLSFRDFLTSRRFAIDLTQTMEGGPRAQFSLSLEITGETSSIGPVTVGRPGSFRDGVIDYRIRQVLMGPQDQSVVMVVERREVDPDDPEIRYMVETFRIR